MKEGIEIVLSKDGLKEIKGPLVDLLKSTSNQNTIVNSNN
jgi:hypothetical protein